MSSTKFLEVSEMPDGMGAILPCYKVAWARYNGKTYLIDIKSKRAAPLSGDCVILAPLNSVIVEEVGKPPFKEVRVMMHELQRRKVH